MKRSVAYDTFTLERVYNAAPSRVFTAFSDPEIKARWFAGPEEWTVDRALFEFRVGGRERVISRPKDAPSHIFNATYMDIVRDQRIVYTYTMHMDDTLTSVSVATFVLEAVPEGTRLVLTEQGAFLDGHDRPGQRESGTRWLLDKIAKAL
jgi:uncharacterized protein YndB with AHSA1/START domain